MLTMVSLAIIAIIAYIVINNARNDYVVGLSIGVLIVACILFVTFLCLCGNIKINEDIEYQNTYYHRATLEYRLENIEKNNVGNEYLYNDIVEFNNSLRSTKKWANNPWTNWFNNQKIAELDYIELPCDN